MTPKSVRFSLNKLFLLYLLVTNETIACGPGRGPGKRRGTRKRTPLVFKQHIPNVSENTVGASGNYEGKITKLDPRFKDMVKNMNPNIIFRDEEDNNEDRMMSKRCKDKLNTLAIAVMNEWPGVKLRVTEAWDTEGHHAPTSLHYEGRAVDITTSDRERSRYGMLARLAVEAGFDWVYYESRSHIHCSVRSDSVAASNYGGCFPMSGQVTAKGKGTLELSKLKIGDEVLALNNKGKLEYSEVIAFLDIKDDTSGHFYSLETENGYKVHLTGKHLIYTSDTNRTSFVVGSVNSQFEAIYADHTQIGDFLLTVDGKSNVRTSAIRSVKLETKQGMVAPLTKAGTIVVDGIVVSCYAFINNDQIAHASFSFLRGLHDIYSYLPFVSWSKTSMASYSIDGIHWYAKLLFNVAPYFMGRDSLYMND
uniref:Hedgehog protein n=1 Tax=Xipholeptos notoides TaxID=66914 RepID=A0A1J0M5M9_9MOLL|nr:hedgehog [Xipholeptos notoides]